MEVKENELAHYGVLGMKWGVRKEYNNNMKNVRSKYVKKQQNLLKKYRDNIKQLKKDQETTAKNAIKKVTGKSKKSVDAFYDNQKKAKGYMRKGAIYVTAGQLLKNNIKNGKGIVSDLLTLYGVGNIATGASKSISNYYKFRKSK